MDEAMSPNIIVEISLSGPDAGGRSTSIASGEYRGILGVGDQHFSVRWFVPISPLVPGGSSGVFGVQFLLPEAAMPFFPVGAIFSVWEGRPIGSGIVLQHVHSEP